MKRWSVWGGWTLVGALALASAAALAQDKKPTDKPAEKPAAGKVDEKKDAGKPQDKPAAGQPEMTAEQKAEMEAWEKYATPGAEHKALSEALVGNWTYDCKSWCDPTQTEPMSAQGVCVASEIMGGRFVVAEHHGEMMGQPFEGTGLWGYDNFKKKHFGAWVDNMGTGLYTMEGTYDAKSKTYTFHGEMPDPVKGNTFKYRETVQIIDKDHYTLTWYESREGKEKKSMEIVYSRKK